MIMNHETSMERSICPLMQEAIDPKGACESCTIEPINVELVRGEQIYAEGEQICGIYCLSSGQVALLKEGECDSDWVVAVLEAGDMLGMPDLLDGDTYNNSAMVLEDGKACFIPSRDARALLRNNPAILMRILQQICRRIHAIEEQM